MQKLRETLKDTSFDTGFIPAEINLFLLIICYVLCITGFIIGR